jgi:hypothetical protein
MSREIANRHWSDAFEALVDDLGGEFRRYGSVVTFLGNLPLPFANGCLVLEPAEPADLEAAIGWVLSAGVPFQVRVDETVLAGVVATIAAHDLAEDPERMPAMVLAPIPAVPPPAPGVAVNAVDASSYADFLDILVDSGIPAEWAGQIFPSRLIDSPQAGYFVATLEGQPAGISVAVKTGASGGIYSVATRETARRRGVGIAVTWAAVDHIRGWGCSAAVLQSSVMGYPVYRAMGFSEVVRYARFTPVPSPPLP